jgi:hypothetical protein
MSCPVQRACLGLRASTSLTSGAAKAKRVPRGIRQQGPEETRVPWRQAR